MSLEVKKSKYIHLFIMLVIVFGFRFIPPFGQMTSPGMQVLGVFIGVIYGWMTIGILLPSAIGIVAMMCSPIITANDFLMKGFGSQNWLMVFSLALLAALMSEADLPKVIISKFMNLRLTKGRPWVIITGFFLCQFMIGAVTSGMIGVLLIIPLYKSLIQQAHLEPYHRLNYVFIIGLIFSSLLGSIALPYTVTVVTVFQTMEAATGVAANLAQYITVATPFYICLIFIYVLLCKYVLRIDMSAFKGLDLNVQVVKANKTQKLVLIFLLVAILLLVAPGALPKDWIITNILSQMGYGGTALAVLVATMIVRVDGKPLMSFSTTAKSLNWNPVFMVAYYMPLINLVSSDSVGLTQTLGTLVTPVVEHMSPVVIVIFMMLMTAIFTNFINNLVSATIFISLLGVISGIADINIYLATIMINLASQIAFILPSACPLCAFALGFDELIKIKTYLKYALVVGCMMFVIMVVLGWYGLGLFIH